MPSPSRPKHNAFLSGRHLLWQRLTWFACASGLACCNSIFLARVLFSYRRINPTQAALDQTAFIYAFTPVLLLTCYGARMLKQGVWLLVILSISGVALKTMALS